jgi:hypothetical protein
VTFIHFYQNSGLMKYAPKNELPGEWTPGVDWPGATLVRVVTTGPNSLFLRWKMIDHELWGNRFFYVVSFRNFTDFDPLIPWDEDWTIGSKSEKIEVSGLTSNRRFELRVGVRKMDPIPGRDRQIIE